MIEFIFKKYLFKNYKDYFNIDKLNFFCNWLEEKSVSAISSQLCGYYAIRVKICDDMKIMQ